jgi:hypothetical protein
MTTVIASLTDTFTGVPVDVIGPAEVPDPDVPVVILLHGMGGGIDDMSQPAVSPGYAVNMATAIVSPKDLGLHAYPGVGVHGVAADDELDPVPTGWQPFLVSQGFITLNYAQVEPWGSIAPVNGQPSEPVQQLNAIITGVIATFPGRRIAFVTHSRGGVLLRTWLVQYGSGSTVRPRLSTAVQLAAPNHGSELADILAALEAVAAVTTALGAGEPFLAWPLYRLLAGLIGGPAIADLQVGGAFLAWLAANEPSTPSGARLELHTFGGTNPTVTRWHEYVFTLQSAVPIITWDGAGFVVTFDWSVWDLPVSGVRNFAGDIGQALQAPPELVPGSGDILVTPASSSLPWQARHYVNQINHAQALWDATVHSQALPVLRKAWGSPALQVEASWAEWSQPAEVVQGTHFGITVTVTNVGTVTWPSGFTVAADDGSGHQIWGPSTVSLTSPLSRGAKATVTLGLIAPLSSAPVSERNLDIYVAHVGGPLIQRGQAPKQILVTLP